jgi:lipid A disaccharide synthetase
MVNILLDEMVVPELIQSDANPGNIFNTASKILTDNQVYKNAKIKLGRVRAKLGSDGASKKAALSILEILNES